MPLFAASGVQVPAGSGVGPVVTGAGHVVVIQSGLVGPEATHEATGTLLVLLFEHEVVIHGNAIGVTGVHEDTGDGPVVTGGGHEVSVQPLPEAAAEAVHDCTATFVELLAVQIVAVYELPELAATGVQVCTPTGAVVTGGGQLVVVQKFNPVAIDGEHEATGTLDVLFVVQVVAVHALPTVAPEFAQVCTGTFVVVLAPQVTVIQGAPSVPSTGVHEATGTLVVMFAPQLVVV